MTFINQAPTLPSQTKRILDAKAFCAEFDLNVLNTVISHRNVYDDADENGLTVIELGTDDKATAEINELLKEFLGEK